MRAPLKEGDPRGSGINESLDSSMTGDDYTTKKKKRFS